jgi:hypothetical protein
MREVAEFEKITSYLIKSILDDGELEIYYSQTENTAEGWRRIKPKTITTDIPPDGEELVPGKDRLSPGHILNAHDNHNTKEELKSFIIGKIKDVRNIKKDERRA